jgi:hypothetical protein
MKNPERKERQLILSNHWKLPFMLMLASTTTAAAISIGSLETSDPGSWTAAPDIAGTEPGSSRSTHYAGGEMPDGLLQAFSRFVETDGSERQRGTSRAPAIGFYRLARDLFEDDQSGSRPPSEGAHVPDGGSTLLLTLMALPGMLAMRFLGKRAQNN